VLSSSPARFPPEFGDDYVPSPYEWIELVKNPLPCDPNYVAPKPGFRCRLDKVIFRDHKTGKRFITEAASLRFQFIYQARDTDPYVHENKPRRLGDGTLRRNPEPLLSAPAKKPRTVLGRPVGRPDGLIHRRTGGPLRNTSRE
jgi:hypothetical protein